MKKLIERVLLELNNRDHLKQLLPNAPITIQFVSEEESYCITLSYKNCSFIKLEEDETADVQIKSSRNILCFLLNGEIRLHQLTKQEELEFQGSYRSSLLIESVLWLCRDYDSLHATA